MITLIIFCVRSLIRLEFLVIQYPFPVSSLILDLSNCTPVFWDFALVCVYCGALDPTLRLSSTSAATIPSACHYSIHCRYRQRGQCMSSLRSPWTVSNRTEMRTCHRHGIDLATSFFRELAPITSFSLPKLHPVWRNIINYRGLVH